MWCRWWVWSVTSQLPPSRKSGIRSLSVCASEDGNKRIDTSGKMEQHLGRGFDDDEGRPVSLLPPQPSVQWTDTVMTPSGASRRSGQTSNYSRTTYEPGTGTSLSNQSKPASNDGGSAKRDRVHRREKEIASRLWRGAVFLRGHQLRKHSRWLLGAAAFDECNSMAQRITSKSLNRSSAGKSEMARGPGTYAEEQAAHLTIPVMPRNLFRDVMAQRTRVKMARGANVTSISGILKHHSMVRAEARPTDLVAAMASAKKSCVLRYHLRWHGIAGLHRALQTDSTRQPTSEALEKVGQVMLEAACENPLPGCLSREQFVSTVSSQVKTCDPEVLRRLYSSFDPDGTSRLRCVDVLACLHVTHKPETQAFLEQIQQTFLRNLGAGSRGLQTELAKGDRQVAWRFLRQFFSLYNQAGGGLGLGLHEVGALFQVCSMSDNDSLKMSSAFDSWMREHPYSHISGQLKTFTAETFVNQFCVAWPLLDLFNDQMKICQAIVKHALLAN